MRIAPLPQDEDQRLAALQALGVLDTPADPGIDGIVRLASAICGTPIAAVSLVDRDRQWFKARVGLGATETPRDVAFCAHAILDDGLTIVADATTDERFADNPLVLSDPNVRFYAGAPLRTSDGFALGTLCVIDTVPRALTAEQLGALEVLRDQVAVHLELIRRTGQAEDALGRASRELAERTAAEARAREALVVVRQQAAELARSAEAMERLHAITTDLGREAPTQLHDLLEFGARAFGMTGGFISSVRGSRLQLDHVLAPAGCGLSPGLTLDVEDTFCAETIRAGRPVMCSRVSGAAMAANTAHRELGIEAFLSAPLYVGGAVRGTVSFFSSQAREEFGDLELRLLDLVANWISAYQARRTAEEQRDRATRARSEFLARMSHEIRTPLHGVIGMVELLKVSVLTDDQANLVQSMDDSSRMLLEIVNDVLDFSKIEAGALALESLPFDAAQLVAEAAGVVRPIARAKRLALHQDLPPGETLGFVGDSARIRQVLVNLLSNAVKYTPAGHIGVTVRGRRSPTGDELVIAVSDTGIGIAADKLGAVFEPFVQAEASTSRRFGGTGLGLAISNRLATLMGGTITVASEPGVGSTFTVTLPLPRSTAVTALAPGVADGHWQPPPGGVRVLVVDDNATNRQIAARMLAKLGVAAEVAVDGPTGIDSALTGGFALVLMDIQMPGMDGFETSTAIRAHLGAASPPILAMTASVSPEERDLCQRAQLPLLAKPFTMDQLRQALATHLPRPSSAGEDLAGTVDEERLEALLSLDEPGSPSLLQLFEQEATERITQLEDAVAVEDARAARRAAHSLKGLAANVGATRLAAAAADVESRSGQGAPAPRANSDLRHELDRFLAAVQARVAIAS